MHEPKEIYVLVESIPYEGMSIMGIFTEHKKAENKRKEYLKNRPARDFNYDIITYKKTSRGQYDA